MIRKCGARTHKWSTRVLAVTAALALAGIASAQDKKASANVAAGYSTLDLSLFAGWQWFQFGQGHNAAVHQFGPAGAWGARVTTVFPKQGHYASDAAEVAKYMTPDVTIDRIDQLRDYDLSQLRAATRG